MITQKTGEVATPEIARPRVPHEVLFAIGGWSGGSPTNFIETYDTRADRWVKVRSLNNFPSPRRIDSNKYFYKNKVRIQSNHYPISMQLFQ